MRRINDLMFSYDNLKDCIVSAANKVDNPYALAYARVFKSVSEIISDKVIEPAAATLVSQTVKLEDVLCASQSGNPIISRLEKYFFSKLRIKDGAIEDLSPDKVQIFGHLIDKHWRTRSPDKVDCLDSHLSLNAISNAQCENCDSYMREMDKVVQTFLVRNGSELVTYNPRQHSFTTYFTDRYKPGEWSSSVISPIGLFIDGRVLDHLLENDMNDALCDVHGHIVVSRW